MRSLIVVAASLLATGCIDLSTDPDEIAAIEFSPLPWPSIVAGDSLRDSTGAAAMLRARLFDGDGDEVSGPLEFLSQRPAVRIVGDGFVVADDTATGSANLLASTTAIQSTTRALEVVMPPDSLAADGAIAPLEWVVPDDPAINVSGPVSVVVLSRAGDEPEGVRAWIVSFELEVEGAPVAATDTTQLFLVGESGRPSYTDTTSTQGQASRRLRLKVGPGLIPPDSAVILVRASYKGVPLAGSPLRLVLPIQPR